MKKPYQSVPQLLEQYVFTVASQFIEQLEKPEQDQLIQLIVRLDSNSIDQTSLGVGQPAEIGFFVNPELSGTAFDEQKKNGSVPTENFRQDHQYPYPIDRLLALQQTHIDSTIMNIANLAILIEHTQNMPMSDPAKKNSLLERYKSFRDNYITYLAKMQGFQHEQRHKLTRYQKQIA